MKLDIVWTSQFKKDYKLAVKRGLKIDLLDNIIRQLSKNLYSIKVKSFRYNQ